MNSQRQASGEGAGTHREGECVVDTRTGRLGTVTGHTDGYLLLRPLTGAERGEWHCPAECARAAMDWERRNADVLDATWRFWRHPGIRPGGGSPPSGSRA